VPSRPIALVAAAAFGLRAACVLLLGASGQYADSIDYLAIAESLLDGRGFAVGTIYSHTRPPLYPLLIAAVWSLTGRSLLALLLAQAAMSAATVVLAARLAVRLSGSERCGIAAAAITAADPFQVYACRLALTETLFLLLFTLALERLASGCRPGPGSTIAIAQSGLAMGACALTREAGLPLAVAMALAATLAAGQRAARQRLVHAALFGLVVGAVIAPWTVRNAVVYGELVPLSTGSGEALYASNNPVFTTGPWPIPGVPAPKAPPGLTRLEQDRYWRAQALAWIRAHPREFALRGVLRLARLLDVVPHATGFATGLYAWISAAYMIPLYVAAAAGFLRLPGSARLLASLPGVALLAVHFAVVGSVRYRMPLHPILAAVAAAVAGPRTGGGGDVRQPPARAGEPGSAGAP
jgi:4-amino-4-deoxy-L-arabinose transferase-like glycosyltransferase